MASLFPLTVNTLLVSAAAAAANERNDTAIPAPCNTASPSPSSPPPDASLSPPSMTFCLQFGDVERQEDRGRRGGGGSGVGGGCRDGLIDKCREGGTWNYSTALIPHVFCHLVMMMMNAGAGHG